MAVNITEIGNVYTSLLTKMLTKYDDMWSNNEIDAETYAKLVAQASTQLVQLSADLVQKQEQLDKDIDIKERNMVLQESELADKLLTAAKQRVLLDEEKETADKNQALLDVQKDIETYKKDTLLLDEHSINIKKVDSIVKDIDVKERSTVVQETELSDKLLTTTKQRLSIDKDNLLKDDELDINIKKKAQLDADTAERLDSTTRANTQLTDQLLSTAKDRDVKEREAVVQEKELADKLLTTAEQRKLLVEQEKEAYTSRVIKDKEAVKAGLDKLNKIISNSPEDMYTPKYEIV